MDKHAWEVAWNEESLVILWLPVKEVEQYVIVVIINNDSHISITKVKALIRWITQCHLRAALQCHWGEISANHDGEVSFVKGGLDEKNRTRKLANVSEGNAVENKTK